MKYVAVNKRDVVIVGGGHNGLVSAICLAKRGLSVTVLEASSQVGGACRHFAKRCGCSYPLGAVDFGLLHPRVSAACGIPEGSLKLVNRDTDTLGISANGSRISVRGNAIQIYNSKFPHKASAIEGFHQFSRDARSAAECLEKTLWDSPPTIRKYEARLNDVSRGLQDRFLNNSLAKTLQHYFTDPTVVETLAGLHLLYPHSPLAPQSAFALGFLSLAEIYYGGWKGIVGGMASLCKTLESLAIGCGVEVLTNRAAVNIVVSGNRVSSVIDKFGRSWQCDNIMMNCAPGVAVKLLRDWPGIGSVAANDRSGGYSGCARLWLECERVRLADTLKHLDAFGHIGSLLFSMPLRDMERSLRVSARGVVPAKPLIELNMSGYFQGELSCDSHYALSMFVMFCPQGFGYPGGSRRNNELVAAILGRVDADLPGFKASVRKVEILGAQQLEQELLLPCGNIDHGNMSLDNLFEERPFGKEMTRSFPIGGVFFCGSGSHSGGLVTGVPGFCAAERLLAGES